MKLDVLNINGKNSGDVEISDSLFDCKINHTHSSVCCFNPF